MAADLGLSKDSWSFPLPGRTDARFPDHSRRRTTSSPRPILKRRGISTGRRHTAGNPRYLRANRLPRDPWLSEEAAGAQMLRVLLVRAKYVLG